MRLFSWCAIPLWGRDDPFSFLTDGEVRHEKNKKVTVGHSKKPVVPEEIFAACMRPSRGLVLGVWLLGHLDGNNSNEST